jgi:hypothetical protein
MTSAPFNLDAIVESLQKEIHRLDSNYREKRNRLIAAITALTGEGASTLNPEIVVSVSKEIQNARLKAVDDAIAGMADNFTTIELRDYIMKNSPPHISAAIKGSYLPTRLTTLASAGKIKLQEQGESGLPNRWIKLQ